MEVKSQDPRYANPPLDAPLLKVIFCPISILNGLPLASTLRPWIVTVEGGGGVEVGTGGGLLPQDKPETVQDEGATQIFELVVFTQAVPELLHCCSWAVNPQGGDVGVGTVTMGQVEPQIPELQQFSGIKLSLLSRVHRQTYPSGCPTGLQIPVQILQLSLLVQIVAFL
jgi:hypothetical protein